MKTNGLKLKPDKVILEIRHKFLKGKRLTFGKYHCGECWCLHLWTSSNQTRAPVPDWCAALTGVSQAQPAEPSTGVTVCDLKTHEVRPCDPHLAHSPHFLDMRSFLRKISVFRQVPAWDWQVWLLHLLAFTRCVMTYLRGIINSFISSLLRCMSFWKQFPKASMHLICRSVLRQIQPIWSYFYHLFWTVTDFLPGPCEAIVHLPHKEGSNLSLDAQCRTVWHIQVNWKGWNHLLSIRMKFSVTLTVNISFSHMTRNILRLENTICFQKLKIKKSEFDILTMIILTWVHGGTGWARFGRSVSDSCQNQPRYQRKYLKREEKESWKQLELEIFFSLTSLEEKYVPISLSWRWSLKVCLILFCLEYLGFCCCCVWKSALDILLHSKIHHSF